MAISKKTVCALNEEMQNIPIDQTRMEELPIEVNQLHKAAEVLRTSHDFDREPSDFCRVLNALKA